MPSTNASIAAALASASASAAPRGYAEAFADVREFVEHAAGGHFAAWEQPAAYASDLRRAVRLGGARPMTGFPE